MLYWIFISTGKTNMFYEAFGKYISVGAFLRIFGSAFHFTLFII